MGLGIALIAVKLSDDKQKLDAKFFWLNRRAKCSTALIGDLRLSKLWSHETGFGPLWRCCHDNNGRSGRAPAA
jgi:hypothetical protein